MFKAKLLSLFSFLGLIFLSENLNIEKEKEVVQSTIKLEEKGGFIKLNDQNISIKFFGYEDVPNNETLWSKKVENESEILEYISPKSKIIFQQKLNLENKYQPLLELNVSSKEEINLKHCVIIKILQNEKPNNIVTNILKSKINDILYEINSFSIVDQIGWISIINQNNIFAIKVNKDNVEISKNEIIFRKENIKTKKINEKYQLHFSCNQYFILKNQTLFNKLEDTVDFGYYLYWISKPIFVVTKKIQSKTKNLFLTFLIIFILFGFLLLPFSLESITMQKILESMQPELNAINAIANLSFGQKNLMIKEVHNRYGYFQLNHFLGQILLIVALTIFQSIFGGIDFLNVIPDSYFMNTFIMMLLCFTIVIYNSILFKNNQIFITVLFSLFFMGYPKLPLLGFIFLHWFNILSFYIYKSLKKMDRKTNE